MRVDTKFRQRILRACKWSSYHFDATAAKVQKGKILFTPVSFIFLLAPRCFFPFNIENHTRSSYLFSSITNYTVFFPSIYFSFLIKNQRKKSDFFFQESEKGGWKSKESNYINVANVAFSAHLERFLFLPSICGKKSMNIKEHVETKLVAFYLHFWKQVKRGKMAKNHKKE